MKITCYLCVALLVTLGICAGVYAFSGFNAIYFLCFKKDIIYRSFLAVNFVAALFTLYAIFTFRPFKGLK